MDKDQRQQYLLRALKETSRAISASAFAKLIGVSRQVIVGDVALLRAQGEDIIATSKGYLLNHHPQHKHTQKIAVKHTPEQTEEELEIFVSSHVEVINVIIDHPSYGDIEGQLNIKTQDDIKDFLAHGAHLLSNLTHGIHLHTVAYQNQDDLDEVLLKLDQAGILYKNV